MTVPRQGVQLCVPFTKERLTRWLGETGYVWVQPKLNGHHLKWEKDALVSSQGTPITSLPHILTQLRESFSGRAVEGEAYCHGMRFQDITSRVKRKTPHLDHLSIGFHVFDEIRDDIVFQLRRRYAHSLIWGAAQPHVLEVPALTCQSYEEVYAHLLERLDEGYEGIVVRHPQGMWQPRRSTQVMKWKPWAEDDYRIVKALEGSGKYAGSLGALIVADPEGTEFHVGSFRIDDQERARLWACRGELPGLSARIKYCEVSREGKPPSSVFLLLVEGKLKP